MRKALGIETAIRINPLYPKKVYDIIGEDMYDFLKEVKKAGTNTIIAGGLRVQSKTREYWPIASVEFMNDVFAEDERFTNFDIKEYMNKYMDFDNIWYNSLVKMVNLAIF